MKISIVSLWTRKVYYGLILLAGLILITPMKTYCEEKKVEPSLFSEKGLCAVDSFFHNIIEEKKLAGATTLIAKNGEMQRIKSFWSSGYNE